MTLTLRKKKGSPLTVEELDNNFLYLKKLISKKSDPAKYIESVAKVEQVGNHIKFIGTLGTELGTVQLPTPQPMRGDWQPETNYEAGDWVRLKQHIYACIKSHKSTEFNEDNFTKLI